MSKLVQIVRGTAPLPEDLPEQFARMHGREMNLEERKFFGLSIRNDNRQQRSVQLKQKLKAA